MRTIHKVTILASLMLIASVAMANTVVVGTCLPSLQKYSTISQAVSSVSAGSTVLVCPGTYPEQVVINQPLTLRGIQSENAANPTITVPSGGLTKSLVLGNGVTMFFQVVAQGTASDEINITDIAVNGSGNQYRRVGSPGFIIGAPPVALATSRHSTRWATETVSAYSWNPPARLR
jgi:hypothetical protein